MLSEEMRKRDLPATVPEGLTAEGWETYRGETLKLFMEHEYGVTPPAPEAVRAEVIRHEENAWAGKAEVYSVSLEFDTPRGPFSFPAHIVLPKTGRPLPLFLNVSFFPYLSGCFEPIEEIVDGGYAIATFCYNDVTPDKDDGFEGGLAAMYPRENPGTAWGKIGMWAFAMSRVLDYALTLPRVDPDRIFTVGHSRLGKTAIWAAVQDERFAGCCSNESGCSGAAVTRGKEGERVRNITDRFPFWFCENYKKYADREDTMPFDQHRLLALMAPRKLYVASAEGDKWSDPYSEFIGASLASEAWSLFGMKGLVNPTGEMPAAGVHLHEGNIGYHMRRGEHFISREDWQAFMRYFDRNCSNH